jgi:hypothetical protein
MAFLVHAAAWQQSHAWQGMWLRYTSLHRPQPKPVRSWFHKLKAAVKYVYFEPIKALVKDADKKKEGL